MGDLNAKIGTGGLPKVDGSDWFGIRNEYCQENVLLVTNTIFKLHPKDYTHGPVDRKKNS